MKKSKRFLALLLGLCMVISLIGCGKDKDNTLEDDKVGTGNESGNESGSGNENVTGTSTGTGSDTYYGDIVLGKYRNVEVQKGRTQATEEDWEQEINAFLEYYAEPVPIEGKTVVENGDTVDIDFVGKVDGVAFEGGSDVNYPLTIGSGQFINGFEEQLIGASVGETKDIEVTFPEDYQSADLAGKDAVFTVTINAVVEYQTLTLSDEVIAKYTEEYDTVEAYKEYMMNYMTEQLSSYAEEQVFVDVIQNIIDAHDISNVPEDMVENVRNNINSTYETYASSMGVTLDVLIYYYFNGMTLDQYNAEVGNLALFTVKQRLILSEIVKLENLTISDDEYNEMLAAELEGSGYETVEELEAAEGKEAIRYEFLLDKALSIIHDTMVVHEYEG